MKDKDQALDVNIVEGHKEYVCEFCGSRETTYHRYVNGGTWACDECGACWGDAKRRIIVAVTPDHGTPCEVIVSTLRPRLGPKAARAAMRMAAGLGATGRVTELERHPWDRKTYRVAPNSTRLCR